MEGLDYLCICCKKQNCTKQKIVVENDKDCKTIKCLEFEKDKEKIKLQGIMFNE